MMQIPISNLEFNILIKKYMDRTIDGEKSLTEYQARELIEQNYKLRTKQTEKLRLASLNISK